MCGFFGVLYDDHEQEIDRGLLEQSADLLQHRGPDSQGIFEAGGVGLVHTRLSLLDLNERSDQPFWDNAKRFALLYNGEIYNHIQLRQKLEGLGVTFRTTGDTEVVLHTLLTFGVEQGIKKFEGMFAFALYDSESRELTIGRDRLGIKPLYVMCRDRAIYFSSEVKAMLPWRSMKPDVPGMIGYMTSGEIPVAGATFFSGVESLPPGSVLTVNSNGIHRKSVLSRADYWNPEQAAEFAAMSDRHLIDELDTRFRNSVQSQLIADAPVGALCSGGVDSSLVLSIAAAQRQDIAIFHANVVGRESEYEHALALARHLDLDLLKIDVHDRDFIDRMPDIIEHREHPYTIQHNSVALLKVAELVNSTGTKAVLTGEGSDEAFLGYSLMMFDLVKVLKRNIAAPFALTGKAWRKLTRRPNPDQTNDHWMKNFGMALAGYQRHSEMPAILEQIQALHGEVPGSKDRISFEWLGYHLRHLLMRNDTLGMASSIESRFPFLDTAVLELAVNLPYGRRVRRSLTIHDREHLFHIDKWPIRALADRYLPRGLARRPKWPFRTSAQDRMDVSWKLLEDSWLADSLKMSNRHVEMLFANTAPNFRNRMLHTYVWGELFLEAMPKGQLVDRLHKHIRF